MPFKSARQRRFMYKFLPHIAQKWSKEGKVKKAEKKSKKKSKDK